MFVQFRVTITGTIDCILSQSYHVLMKENQICVFDKPLLLDTFFCDTVYMVILAILHLQTV